MDDLGPITNYQEALGYLLALVDHERQTPSLPRQKRIYDLRRVGALLERLDNPHLSSRTVHIAGTKGKGSTAAMVDSILSAAGYRTGFYSSPHLHTFRERIRLDGFPIDESGFTALVANLAPVARSLSEETELGPVTLFEFMTAMAFQGFAQHSVDFQTIEVGLGGRLDATNVVDPEVCAITSVSLDHMAILGDTVEEIAGDKAGIIKPGVPLVVAPQRSGALKVILKVAEEKQAPVTVVGKDVRWKFGERQGAGQSAEIYGRRDSYNVTIPLLGRHQLENVGVAVAIIEVLAEKGYQIDKPPLVEGLKRVSWPCRLEVLAREPTVVSDGAHNVYSMETMLASLREYVDFRRLIALVGFSRDKSVSGMVEALGQHCDMAIATRSRHPRSMAPAALSQVMKATGIGDVRETRDVSEALRLARQEAGPQDLILATGSLFVAAEVREAILGIEPEVYPDLLPPDLR